MRMGSRQAGFHQASIRLARPPVEASRRRARETGNAWRACFLDREAGAPCMMLLIISGVLGGGAGGVAVVAQLVAETHRPFPEAIFHQIGCH